MPYRCRSGCLYMIDNKGMPYRNRRTIHCNACTLSGSVLQVCLCRLVFVCTSVLRSLDRGRSCGLQFAMEAARIRNSILLSQSLSFFIQVITVEQPQLSGSATLRYATSRATETSIPTTQRPIDLRQLDNTNNLQSLTGDCQYYRLRVILDIYRTTCIWCLLYMRRYGIHFVFQVRHFPGPAFSRPTFSVPHFPIPHFYMHLYFARSRQSKTSKREKPSKNKYIAKEINTIPPW